MFKYLPAFLCIKSLLTNYQLQGYYLLHHILQSYHPLYREDTPNHMFELSQQQGYIYSTRCTFKLSIQEYYDTGLFP